LVRKAKNWTAVLKNTVSITKEENPGKKKTQGKEQKRAAQVNVPFPKPKTLSESWRICQIE
jgi:hypothetical protein